MTIEFEGRSYALHYSFRIGMLYEQIQEKSIDFSHLNQLDLITLFYATFLATLQYHKVNHNVKFEEFMNWIDDNGGEQLILEFTNWYIDSLTYQAKLMSKKEVKGDKGEPDPNV